MVKGGKEAVVLGMLTEMLNEVVPVIVDEGKKAWTEIKENTKQQVGDFIACLNNGNVEFRKVESMNSEDLISIAKENVVTGANEVYAWKTQDKGDTYINLAYGKDGELLEKARNKFVVIKPKELSEDLLDMFEESELIILE